MLLLYSARGKNKQVQSQLLEILSTQTQRFQIHTLFLARHRTSSHSYTKTSHMCTSQFKIDTFNAYGGRHVNWDGARKLDTGILRCGAWLLSLTW